MILVVFGRNRLSYVITGGILIFVVCLSMIKLILLSRLIRSRCSLMNNEWYPCFTKLLFISLRLLFKSRYLIWTYSRDLDSLTARWNIFQWFWVFRCYVKIVLSISFFSVYPSGVYFCRYVDIFQCLETQFDFSKPCNIWSYWSYIYITQKRVHNNWVLQYLKNEARPFLVL